ncbi:sensor histidine kinase [Pseudoalteromonas luteoviolacea]|uniref:sensor histidine kinase n=1 Tax=Pseudoalteromonas luteoviolacea TaxID=43657 RepID=UPI001152A8E8|nr:ATP-binding protein [Pseudoalteromonas luteoviolacea]TQF71574.1 histidine kinase [Pseudoalteromonas luteoviolacea]
MKLKWSSLAGKMACFCAGFILMLVAMQFGLTLLGVPFEVATGVSLLLVLPMVFVCCEMIFRQHKRAIDTLTNGLKSIQDGDFSIRLSSHHNADLTEALVMYNKLAQNIKHQRQSINQRELLLDSIVQASPMGIVLLDTFHHIVYFNNEATQLLQRPKLDGVSLHQCVDKLHPNLQRAIAERQTGLISFEQNDQKQSYYLSFKKVMMNQKHHQLLVFKNVSNELSQEEINMWKNAIRLISHELNNSLAPISSLTTSAKTMVEQSKHLDMLPDILQTIDQRTTHLSSFIAKYAQFAKLPKPNMDYHELAPLFEQVSQLYPFQLLAPLPVERAFFDLAQMEQVLINILKNAHESGSKSDDVAVKVVKDYARLRIAVVDRGSGIIDGNHHQALLPFYSTKADGTGLGLSLCNDIVYAHQGHIKLKNRQQGGLMVEFDIPLQDTTTI